MNTQGESKEKKGEITSVAKCREESVKEEQGKVEPALVGVVLTKTNIEDTVGGWMLEGDATVTEGSGLVAHTSCCAVAYCTDLKRRFWQGNARCGPCGRLGCEVWNLLTAADLL